LGQNQEETVSKLPAIAFVLAAFGSASVMAQVKYGPGTSATEIKVGQSVAYSGPASAYGQLGKAEAAYFKSLNAKGGVNGRKINFISLDDGYSPPKVVENARKLVENDEVAVVFNVLGTPLNMAIRSYLNQKKVPQLFIAAGATAFNDPAHFPWTMGWQPNLQAEASFYAEHLLKSKPDAKIAVLYQNDDFGKDLLNGLTTALGDKAKKMIVDTQNFQATDPTVDSQLITLKNSGADTLFLFTYSKQAAQSISKLDDLNWKPTTYLHLGAASIGATFKPAGLEKSKGILSAGFLKDVTDPKWANDEDVMEFFAWMKENLLNAEISDTLNEAGYMYAKTLEQVLRQAGSDLTRENIMKQAASLRDFRLPLLLPGSTINTTAADYRIIKYMKLQRFNGKTWDFVD
jgi:branched-chain amino acid transport system substrate-binding protein